MPIPPPFPASPAHNALFPALYLYPLNDTWAPKHIALTSAHTKIGRQTSSKTAPGERNGFFDSKVLSRQHAEVWEEGGKIFIKDVKSSNGTFINGERLSSEGHESEPFELKSDDIVEFGIDIVGEDNKTIIHHKVAARVVCVFSEQDAAVAARAEQHQAAAAAQHAQQQQHHLNLASHQQQQQHLHHQQQQQLHQAGLAGIPQGGHHGFMGPPNGLGIGAGGAGAGSFPFASGTAPTGAAGNAGPNAPGQQRRPLAHNGLGGMGAPPSLARAPGRSSTGISFDVILSRLQGEVQKSRETGAELGGLATLMGDVEGVLGGRGPPNLQAFPAHLPPVRPPTEAAPQPPPTGPMPAPPNGALPPAPTSPASDQQNGGSQPPPSTQAVGPTADGADRPPASPPQPAAPPTVAVLQAQLAETQASLAAHLERVRALEGVLKEQEAIRHEVGVLRGLVEGRREGEASSRHVEGDRADGRFEHDELTLLERGVHEGIPIGLEDVLEEDEDEEEDDDDDDGRSVGTVMAHELERVDEEDEEALIEDERASREAEHAREQRHEEEEEDHFRPADRSSGEEQSAFDHERDDDEQEHDESHDGTQDNEHEHEETQQEIDEQERRRAEDLGVGRPRTPEPSMLGLGIGLGMAARERRSSGSPLSTSSSAAAIQGSSHAPSTSPTASTLPTTPPTSSVTTADVHAQVERLAAQVGAVLALTTTLEKQHASAQRTIRDLEDKVRSLEGLLEKSQSRSVAPPAKENEPTNTDTGADSDTSADSEATLVDADESLGKEAQPPSALAAWTRTIAGQWSTMQADWTRERTALAKAQEEWEARTGRLDGGLAALDGGLARLDGGLTRLDAGLSRVDGSLARTETALGKADGVQSAVAGLLAAQERVREAVREQGGRLEAHIAAYQVHIHASEARGSAWGGPNGDAVKVRPNGGLVTPPSPRSQSSDSARYRRRRRRSSGSPRAGSPERADGESASEEDDDDGKHGIRRALEITASTAVSVSTGILATPASSVYGLRGEPHAEPSKTTESDSIVAAAEPAKHANGVLTAPATRANSSAISEVASLPLLALALCWTVVLILSFSLSLLSFGLAYLLLSLRRVHAWMQDSLALSLDDIIDGGQRALEERAEERAKVHPGRAQAALNMQAAMGVVLLSVAAAAVFWKVKPE